MQRLGYAANIEGQGDSDGRVTTAPAGRRAFVGDLVDRGPRSPGRAADRDGMVGAGQAFAVPGNHDVKFLRWLGGRQVRLTHGLDAPSRK